jgi:hypothetical protein
MSFRLFIYYCALCGAGSALLGWALGRGLAPGGDLLPDAVKGLFLGLTVALALILVDTFWNASLTDVGRVSGRVLVVGTLGACGGFLGSGASKWLFNKATFGVVLVLGWALVGALVGASLGVFDLLEAKARGQNARGAAGKVRNGLLGGAAGGLLGGALDVALHGALQGLFPNKDDRLLWAPSAWGFAALGACIGLLIGLAQVILKEAWLRIDRGPRAGKEQILSKPVVTIGRAEGCDVGLFGDPTVEKLHARIDRQGDDYVLCDAGSASGTYVNDQRLDGPRVLRSGDAIRIGRWVLRFGERAKAPAGR